MRKITPKAGYVLTQRDEATPLEQRVFAKEVFLAVNDSIDNWKDILESEAEVLKEQQRVLLEQQPELEEIPPESLQDKE